MKKIVVTNRPEYFNDISEVIRLFHGLVEIELEDAVDKVTAPECVHAEVAYDGESGTFHAKASCGNSQAEYRQKPDNNEPLEIKRVEKRCLKNAVYLLFRELYPEVSVPWGALTGIRPTKLFREITQRKGIDAARRDFIHVYDVSEKKTSLAEQICSVQYPHIVSVRETDADVYVGIPFCRTKCLYCSFASEVIGKKDKLSPYLEVLKEDISAGAELFKNTGRHLRTIYFGGGTPTVLNEKQLDDLFLHTFRCYSEEPIEITVEAGRPDTITEEKLRIMKAYGVKRISVNPQTMSNDTLQHIGRAHRAEDIVETYELARRIGFESINMDLIAGLPGESFADFRKSLDAVYALQPENVTVHSLALKRSSRLKQYLDQYHLPEAAETERMIEYGYESAAKNGLYPYYMYRQKYMSGNLENVGYARPGTECIYNIDMMEETTSIMAHGGSGISKLVVPSENRVERIANPKEVSVYMEKLPVLLQEKGKLFQ